MTVLLLGGTGRTGGRVLQQLLSRGIHVRAAHTDGDVFIHFRKANVIHTGDLVFAGMYPFIDINSGGSVAGVIAARTVPRATLSPAFNAMRCTRPASGADTM